VGRSVSEVPHQALVKGMVIMGNLLVVFCICVSFFVLFRWGDNDWLFYSALLFCGIGTGYIVAGY
jgi:vacuolar-type H+-ATPase subunit I/STV1